MELEEFYTKYSWYIEVEAKRLTRSTLDKDVVIGNSTEKIVKAFKNGSYAEDGKAFAWLKRLVGNTWKDELRKRVKGHQGKSVRASYFGDEEEFDEDHNIALGIDPEEIDFSDSFVILLDAIDSLSDEQRDVLLHRIESHFSFKEISEVQDASVNTVLGRMRYAKKNLLLELAKKMPKGQLYTIVHTNPKMREFVNNNPELKEAIKRPK